MSKFLAGSGWAATLAALAIVAPCAPAQAVQVQMLPASGGPYTVSVVSYRDMPFRTVIRQQYDFSCGSAALATLLHYQYGQAVDETEVFKSMWAAGDHAAIQAKGFSLADMKRYLASRGLKSDGYRVPLERYAQARTPAIAVIQVGGYKHFVVIKSVRNGEVLVGDPAIGLHAYTLDAFKKVWDGLIFVVHDNADPPDHHGFDSLAEWELLPSRALEPAAHGMPDINQLQVDEIRTVFQVLPVNLGSNF